MLIRARGPEASGDPVLRVVVHRGLPSAAMVGETALTALHHFGVPYRTVDLAKRILADEDLAHASGVLLAQEGLGGFLTAGDIAALGAAVKGGLGLISLDGSLLDYPDGWWDFLGLGRGESAIPCVLLRIADSGHPITARRRPGEEVTVKTPVPLQGLRLANSTWRTLVDTGRAPEVGTWGERRPALIARTVGAGCVVQVLVSPRIWLRQHVGHGNGLTDLLWRSIAWSARRPFVMQAMPPFVTTRLDNVTGSRDGFGYLQTLIRHGYVAVAGLYTREVHEEGLLVLQRLSERGQVECSAHSLDEDCRNLVYGTFDLAEPSEHELAERFAEVDQTFKGWGIPQAAVVNAHWGIVSRSAVPFLRARGQRFVMKPLRFGAAMYSDLEAVNEGWRPRPFGSYDLVMDAMPEGDDFYVASVQLPRNEGIDFLQGCPGCGDDDPIRDVEQAAQKGARMLRRGLENLFFGCLLTHEGRVYALPEGQLDLILGRIDQILDGWPRFHRGYDYVARYARSRDGSYIERVRLEGERIVLALAGESEVEQYLYLFADQPDRLRPLYCPIPAFGGEISLTCDRQAALEALGPPGAMR